MTEDSKLTKTPSLRRGNKNLHKLVKTISRIQLLSPASSHFTPSLIASSCIFLSRQLIGLAQSWRPELMRVTGYSEQDLSKCVKILRESVSELRIKGGLRLNTSDLFLLLKKLPASSKLLLKSQKSKKPTNPKILISPPRTATSEVLKVKESPISIANESSDRIVPKCSFSRKTHNLRYATHFSSPLELSNASQLASPLSSDRID